MLVIANRILISDYCKSIRSTLEMKLLILDFCMPEKVVSSLMLLILDYCKFDALLSVSVVILTLLLDRDKQVLRILSGLFSLDDRLNNSLWSSSSSSSAFALNNP